MEKKKLKKELLAQIILLLIFMSVFLFALGAYITKAWFATNYNASIDNSNITSATASPSLYIRESNDNTKVYATNVITTSTHPLFPISTANLENWYYASGFTFQQQQVNNYIIATPFANQYTAISSFVDADGGIYYNTYEEANKTAYVKSSINLYTTIDTLDVYLDSTNPVVINYVENAVPAKELLSCLRVGIASNSMLFIYAPVAESGAGNSTGATADTFYCINAGNLTNASSLVKTSLTDFTAELTGVNTYSPTTGAHSLGTATENGLDLTVYIWLEGTDAQALYGLVDNDIKGINVQINFVGVIPTP